MRIITFILFVFTVTISLTAHSVPQYLSHQGHIVDSASSPVTGVESTTFSIYDSPDGQTPTWSEILEISFDNGYFSVELGTVETLPEDLFDGNNLYLGITLGDAEEFSPRYQITSVPYCFLAERAESVTGEVNVIGDLTVGGTEVVDEDGNWIGPDINHLDENRLDTYLSDNSYVTGSGTTNQMAKFVGTTEIGNSALYEVDGNVGINISEPVVDLDVEGDVHVGGYLRMGSSTEDCNNLIEGAMRYNQTLKKIEFCNGLEWKVFDMEGQDGQTRNTSGLSCKDILAQDPASGDGIYWIDPNEESSIDAFPVYCDMTTDGGGWTLVIYQEPVTKSFTGRHNPAWVIKGELPNTTPSDDPDNLLSNSNISFLSRMSTITGLKYDAYHDGSWISDYIDLLAPLDVSSVGSGDIVYGDGAERSLVIDSVTNVTNDDYIGGAANWHDWAGIQISLPQGCHTKQCVLYEDLTLWASAPEQGGGTNYLELWFHGVSLGDSNGDDVEYVRVWTR